MLDLSNEYEYYSFKRKNYGSSTIDLSVIRGLRGFCTYLILRKSANLHEGTCIYKVTL